MNEEKKGIVYLIGAGPGDVGLLTLKAVDALKKAEVLVYDRLAEERILSFAPFGCEKIYVGKASSNHAMKQEDINKLLVQKAKEGKTVVRLKGGDPFVFGRGGEEALVLKEENLPFVIVPGVTSAIAAAAYAGIPVTHRKIATSFAVVTGHEDPTKADSSIRWKELATATDTVVFLMGVENLSKITRKLTENGRDKNTPAALVRWGTRAEQEVLVTTVENAAKDVEKAGLKPPAVFIVGEVVKLREKLQWFDNSPLFGKRILVTRARAQASALTELLEEQGARVTEAPVIKIEPPADNYAAIDGAIQNIEKFSYLIFTSANGVREFFARLYFAKKDARALNGAKVVAIGKATAEGLSAYGINADIVPKEFRAEGVVDALKDKIDKNDNILIPRAEVAREILPKSLEEFGAKVTVAPVYKTVTETENGEKIREMLLNGEIDIVTFTSSSTVTNFVKLVGDANLLKSVKTACIGPVTAETLKKEGIEPEIIAKEYTIQGLVNSLNDLFSL